jgi:hypothetical protein
METRPFFLAGDLAASALIGGIIGALSALLVDTSWNMWVAHVVCMVIGMVLAFPLALPFMAFFGAMEVMVPTHVAGMCAGMWVGMQAAMQPVSAASGFATGIWVGLASLVLCYAADAALRWRGDPRGSGHQA